MNRDARSGILAGGNWIVDKLKVIDAWPAQDTLANILSDMSGNGGGPFNVLVDLARLGAPFPLAGIGLVGRDADGDWIKTECAANRIDAAQIAVTPDAPTSYSDVMTVRSSGRRTFFHQRGANARLGPEHFDFAKSSAKIFYLGYLLLLDRLDESDDECGTVAARVLRDASAAGCKTAVDVVSEESDRYPRIVLPVLPHTDYLLLNEFEAGRTTGIAVRRGDQIDLPALEQAAHELLRAGVREWVIIHSPEMACALGRDGVFHVQDSIRAERIVSAVGAGDAFAAGVLYALHEELPIGEALRYGVCVAAACLAGASASDAVPPLAECLASGRRALISE